MRTLTHFKLDKIILHKISIINTDCPKMCAKISKNTPFFVDWTNMKVSALNLSEIQAGA